MNLNKAMVIGNLTRDPEVRNTQTGKTVASFAVATNEVWKDAAGARQEKAEYHNVVAWGKLAEICQQYLHKGKKIYIEGRLQTREWTGQDGIKRYKTEIVADNMIMLDNKGANGPTNVKTPASTESSTAPAENQGEPEIKMEDIPF